MRSLNKISLVAAALMSSTMMVQAADLVPPPEYNPPEVAIDHAGGWYIRGDIGYAKMNVDDVTYFQGAFQTGSFEQSDLDSTWTLQGGIGYQVTDYLRVDATLKYIASSDFDGSSAPAGSVCNGFVDTCTFNDDAELESATLLMANAYWDLGTYHGITPYLGAGIGGAHVKWGDLLNDQTCLGGGACDGEDFRHAGEAQWRFAWAVHAGASYDVRCDLTLDAGYTYTRIEGGEMFGTGVGVPGSLAPGVAAGGNVYDGGIDVHEGRMGIRYALGGSGCGSTPVYDNEIVYK